MKGTPRGTTPQPHADAPVLDPVHHLLLSAGRPDDVGKLAATVAHAVGAVDARVHVADYAQRRLQLIGAVGPVGEAQPVAGTLVGRAFTSREVIVNGNHPAVITVPLVERSEAIGVLELVFDAWDGVVPRVLAPAAAALVAMLISGGRYSDEWARARRSESLSPAAEIQWDLLPPLSCDTDEVAVGGVLEPAYDIGGDSFDYAFNHGRLEFSIVDAVGRGMSAVLMSTAVINSLRYARRARLGLPVAYEQADAIIRAQFDGSAYVTAQAASLDLGTGLLSWVNAGHVLPMLVRNGRFAGQLQCLPSLPIGLGGAVAEVAVAPLQAGDRVLFYTDGITESCNPLGDRFGEERLGDYLVRSALERTPVQETARRLATHVLEFSGEKVNDDATLLLVEYRGHGHS